MATKTKGWVVTLNKVRATWHWFVSNPQGGGFGSNATYAKHIVLGIASRNIPAGAEYILVTKHNNKTISTETRRKS